MPGGHEYCRALDVPGLLEVLRSYLQDRQFNFAWEGTRVRKFLTKACPQGSILDPLLWNIMFETLLRVDISVKNKIIAYADDAVLLISGDS